MAHRRWLDIAFACETETNCGSEEEFMEEVCLVKSFGCEPARQVWNWAGVSMEWKPGLLGP